MYYSVDEMPKEGDSVESPSHYKKCFRCQKNLLVSSFALNKVKKDGRQERCRACCKEHRINSGYAERQKDLVLQSKYSISIGDLNKMKEDQEGLCAICGIETNLFVDHCHTTGKVRSLLCHFCNTAIGLFREDVTIMKEAIKYIEEHKNDG